MRHKAKNLEVHVVDHCNLDCVGCSHESPLLPKWLEDPERLATALERLWAFYRVPLIKLLGGEPLLHPNLPLVIESARRSTDARVRIVTNGSLLERRWKALRGVDEVHISHYPGVKLLEDRELSAVSKDLRAPITVQPFDAFRWHRSPVRHHSRTISRVFASCQMYHRWDCHTLRDSRFSPCPPAATWGSDADGVNLLDPAIDLADELRRLLGRSDALDTCGSCMGSAGGLIDHRRGWRREQGSRQDATLDESFLQTLEADADAWNGCWRYDRTFFPDGAIRTHPAVG